jgi:hypothetical protein
MNGTITYCIYTNSLLSKPRASVAEVATGKPKRNKSPGLDQIPTELIQAGRETLHLEIHKLIKLTSNKDKLHHQWKESTVAPIHKRAKN